MSGIHVYEFDDVRVDIRRMVVSKGGQVIDLEPKSFDVLRFLIAHCDEVVTKEQLMDAVWRDTFVTPNVLTRAIAQLRKAIGDDARSPRYIDTVATRGYRFIAPVTEIAVAGVVADPAAAPADMKSPLSVRAGSVGTGQKVPEVASSDVPLRELPASPSRRWARVTVIVAMAVIGVIAFFWRARSPANSTAATTFPTVRRLAGAAGGYFSEPSLSPDGQAVAYVSDKSGSLEIYVVGLAPGSREITITNDGAQNVEPDWSPDGQWIAYHSKTPGGIWIVPSTGGAPRQVIEFGSQPSWSPDSQTLAVSSDVGAMAAQSNLWIVRRDGSARRIVTRIGMPNGGHHEPSWSHDGRFIAFALLDPSTKTSMWTVSVADGELRQLEGLDGSFGGFPRFGRDDQAIYWASRSQGNGRIFKMPLTGATHDPAGSPQPVLAYNGIMDGLSIAGNGRSVYGTYSEDSNLWSVDVRPDASTPEPTRMTSGARNFRASYSKGGQIAYVSTDVGTPFAVWTMNEDGTHQEPLVTDFIASMPQWIGDDSRLLVVQVGRPEDDKLWWVDAATRRTSPIALPIADVSEPRISPDGTQLAFHVVQPNGAISVWTQPVTGGTRRRLTPEDVSVSYPNWSRDGRWLSVQVTRSGVTNVGVMPSRGGPIQMLTADQGQSWPNTWSPDSEWIAFAGERDAVWNIWTVSRGTHEEHQLTNFKSADGYVRWPAWSPRGDRIIFERNTWTGSVWTTQLP